jgi:hypothetical protein
MFEDRHEKLFKALGLVRSGKLVDKMYGNINGSHDVIDTGKQSVLSNNIYATGTKSANILYDSPTKDKTGSSEPQCTYFIY